MDWVAQFYARQDQLAGVYTGGAATPVRERVDTLERLAGPPPKRVLELGAGGGQAAAAAADLGYEVVAIEFVPVAADHARALASDLWLGSLTVLQDDFYTASIEGPFDVVCYWDGFGLGTDDDQRRLLRRILDWLSPGGSALIDVNTPWYWAQVSGREFRIGSAIRRYGFDAAECRLLDAWWAADDEAHVVTQSLRCYSPADLKLLMEGSGLQLVSIEPGGAVDYEAGTFAPSVSLERAMQYLAVLAPVG